MQQFSADFYMTKEENIALIVVATRVSLEEITEHFPFQSAEMKEAKQN